MHTTHNFIFSQVTWIQLLLQSLRLKAHCALSLVDPFERINFWSFCILIFFYMQKLGTKQEWSNCLSFWDNQLASVANLIKSSQIGCLSSTGELANSKGQMIWPNLFSPPLFEYKRRPKYQKIRNIFFKGYWNWYYSVWKVFFIYDRSHFLVKMGFR